MPPNLASSVMPDFESVLKPASLEQESIGKYYSGLGRLTFANGDHYEGQFIRGKIFGQGKLTSHGGSRSYEGNFHNGFK